MIETNDILLVSPYNTNRVKYLQQFHTMAKERKIKRSSKNLANFRTTLGPKAIKIFEPVMHQDLQDQNENQRGNIFLIMKPKKNL